MQLSVTQSLLGLSALPFLFSSPSFTSPNLLSVSLLLFRTGVAANQPLILTLQGAVTLHCGKFSTSWLKLEHIGTLMLWQKIPVHPMTYEQTCQDMEPFKRLLFYSSFFFSFAVFKMDLSDIAGLLSLKNMNIC